MEQAQVLHEHGKYRGILFHCHLAVEKAMKAAHIREHNTNPPKTHNLVELARALSYVWSTEKIDNLDELTDFVVDARYGDPDWSEHTATEERSSFWFNHAEIIISKLQS